MNVLDLIPQTEKETLRFRLLALLAVGLAFVFKANDVPLVPTIALLVGYLIYSYLLRSVLIPRYTSYPLLGAMLMIDVGTIVAALHFIGLDSPVFGLLPVVVVYYSLYLGYAGGIAAATVCTLGYTLLVLGTDDLGENQNLLAIQPFFYVVALLVGYTSQHRFRETQERRSLQQLIGAEAHAKSLLDLAQALNRVLDRGALTHDLARVGALVARVPFSVVFLHDAERNVLVYQGGVLPSGIPTARPKEEVLLSVDGNSFLSEAWASGKVTTFTPSGQTGADSPEDGDEAGPEGWIHKVGATHAMACPVMADELRTGVMGFMATSEVVDSGRGGFDAETVEAAKAFCGVAGRILSSIEVYSTTERRSRRVTAELQQSIEDAGRFRELAQRRSMRFGPLMIEPSRESVRWQDTVLRLSKTEFDLMYVLAEQAGNPVSQETLVREVWGQDYVPQSKVVDVTVHRLRRKLSSLPEGRRLIRTVRGQGYSFVPPDRFVSAS